VVTVAVVGNEFFDERITRMGGFGFSTQMVGRIFKEHPELGVRLVYVMANPSGRLDGRAYAEGETLVHGWPLINLLTTPRAAAGGAGARAEEGPQHGRAQQSSAGPAGQPDSAGLERMPTTTLWSKLYLLRSRVDLLLLIDFRNDYLPAHAALPHVPMLLWARDPRTQRQRENIKEIRLPGDHSRAQGTKTPDARGASALFKTPGVRIAVGVTWAPALRERARQAYLLPKSAIVRELPNSIGMCNADGGRLEPKPPGTESSSPSVLFLARLDPYKRPWLLVELAKAYPEVTFYVAGQSHFTGPGSFQPPPPSEVPNVRFLGHVASEADKAERLARVWFVVNLSVHEGIAVSWLEALHCCTPVLSTVNPGGIVSRYGVFVGQFGGSGMQGMPQIRQGFERLLRNTTLRRELGVAGRRHVQETHNTPRFIQQFVQLANTLGVGRAPEAAGARGG
jgi:glycosyltransferase involved in cell wall biosynthesis